MALERDWTEATVEGFQALALARYREAAESWIGALGVVPRSDLADPLLAAGQSNAGVGSVLSGRMRQAATLFDEAERTWRRVAAVIETLDVPLAGTSSSFHFRLASQNLAAFQNARRKRYAELCAACLAITRFNRLLATAGPPAENVVAREADALAHVLAAILGPRAPEIRLLSEAASHPRGPEGLASPYAEKAAAFASRSLSPSAIGSDACRTLEAAFDLTALLAPSAVQRGAAVDEDGALPPTRNRATALNG